MTIRDVVVFFAKRKVAGPVRSAAFRPCVASLFNRSAHRIGTIGMVPFPSGRGDTSKPSFHFLSCQGYIIDSTLTLYHLEVTHDGFLSDHCIE